MYSWNHVNNGNLRDNRFYHDTKHLNKRFGIPALAKNIKKEIRNAFYPRQNFISKENGTDVAQSYKPGYSSNGNPVDTAQPPNGQNYIYDHSTTKTNRLQDQLQNMASMLQYSSGHMVMSTNNSIRGQCITQFPFILLRGLEI